jgi:cytochrome c5
MKQFLVISSLAIFVAMPPAKGADFKKDVLPIFESSCGKCHMQGTSKGDLSLDADKISLTISSSGAIKPKDAEGSELFKRITMPEGTEHQMPPKGGRLGKSDVRAIKEWIEAGALLEAASKPEAPKPPQPVLGDWTNVQGKTITATLIKVEGDKAHLQMANGTTYPYPIGQLSAESQAKVKAFMEASAR